MAIISANRYSKMNGNYVIAANESYGTEDIGRILIENEQNDMAIFNAVLKSDLHEIRARQEGTLLESEIQALSENAVKDLFNTIIAKLKKFWAKLKGVFQKAYAMITAYVIRNGKAFITANKKALADLKDDVELKGEMYVPEGGLKRIDQEMAALGAHATVKVIRDDVVAKMDRGSSASEITKAAIKHFIKDYNEDKTVYEFLKDKYYKKATNPTLAQCGGKVELQGLLLDGTKSIKALKKEEKKFEAQMKTSIKELENAARKVADTAEGEAKEAAAKEANFYKTASTAFTNGMSVTMKASIKLVKFQLAQARIALAKAIGASVKMESTLLESMIMEAAEGIEDMEDADATSLTPEEAEIAAEVMDTVAEIIEDEAEGCTSDDNDSDDE